MASNDITKFVDGNGDEFNFRDPSKEAVANKVTSIRASSSASDDKYPSEKAVASAIEALDVSSVGGSGEYISAISETDGKISATATTMDTTPTANSTNAVTSGGVKAAIGNASTEDRLYANQKWGGAFRATLSPLDTYFILNKNYFLGVAANCVSVEYSTDGGSTWIDYGLTDLQKRNLFNQFATVDVYCGKNTHIQPGYNGSITGTKDLTDEIIADQRLRITISSRPFGNAGTTSRTGEWMICSNMRRFAIYMSTQSASSKTHCKVQSRTIANFCSGTNTWVDHGDYPIVGDSGWNSIPIGNDSAEGGFGFGDYDSVSTTNRSEFRFEIWSEKLNTNPASSQTGNLCIKTICSIADKLSKTTSKFRSILYNGLCCTSVDMENGWPVFGNGIKFTARKLKTKLDRTADSTFDGSADQLNIPVTGTLPVGNGGTGKASVTSGNYLVGNGTSALTEKTPKYVGNNVLTALDPGTDTAFFQDDEVLGSNHSGGATDTTKFVRRPVESLWNYIKGRISSVLGLSESNGVKTFTGNAATATDLAANSVLSVTKGGTGKSSVTSNSYLKGNGTGALVERTYAEVRTDLGLGSVYSKNVPSSGNASTTQVVMGNDTRLSDARTPTAHTHNTDAADVTDSPGSTVITDSTEFVTTNIYGYGDGDKKLYRRNFGSYIWPWIRSKLSSDTSVVVSGTAKEVGGTMVLEDSSDTRIGLIGVTTLGETTSVKYECLITVEATAGMGNNGSGIVLLAKGNARGTTAYNHSLSILNINKWNVRDYRPMIWNVSSGNGIVTMFGIWDASNNQLAPFTYSRVTVTKLTASEQNVNWLFTHDNGSWSESSTYLTTFASGAATELVDYSTSNINWRIRCGWDGPSISKVYPTPIQSTLQQSAYLLSLHTEGYTAFYKEVRAENVTVGNSLKWNGYDLVIGQAPTTPADNTIYIF